MINYKKYIISFFVVSLLLGGITNCVVKQKIIKCNKSTNCDVRCAEGTTAEKYINNKINSQDVTILHDDIINHKLTVNENSVYTEIKSINYNSTPIYIFNCNLSI